MQSGNDAVFQCVVEGNANNGGSFTWNGPAVAGNRASVSLDSSGTVSTLTIISVNQDDEGKYSCSYTGAVTVFITLEVQCKLNKT